MRVSVEWFATQLLHHPRSRPLSLSLSLSPSLILCLHVPTLAVYRLLFSLHFEKPQSALEHDRKAMQYSPFASDIELPFYTALASHKINHDKLDDSARPVLGLYEIRSVDPANASCRMQIHGNALTSNESVRSPSYGLGDFRELTEMTERQGGSTAPRA